MEFTRCQQNSSPLPCAEKSEIDKYMARHALNFGTLHSFIEYDNVEPGISPVKQFFKPINNFILSEDLNEPKQYDYNFIEHQISLEDSLF